MHDYKGRTKKVAFAIFLFDKKRVQTCFDFGFISQSIDWNSDKTLNVKKVFGGRWRTRLRLCFEISATKKNISQLVSPKVIFASHKSWERRIEAFFPDTKLFLIETFIPGILHLTMPHCTLTVKNTGYCHQPVIVITFASAQRDTNKKPWTQRYAEGATILSK